MCRVRTWILASLAVVLSLACGLRSSHAIGFTWIAGDGNWHVPQFWAPFSPPVMGPPGLGDAALIAGDRNVTLNANATVSERFRTGRTGPSSGGRFVHQYRANHGGKPCR